MADIYLGSTDLSSANFYLGSDAVSALYQGSTQLWSAAPAWVTTNLISYIDPFASTISGGTASDLSGNGNNATQQNSIAVTGAIGGTGGWQLNATGTSAKYLDLGLAGYSFSSGFTAEVWLKLNNATFDSEPHMIGSYDNVADDTMAVAQKRSNENYIVAGNARGTNDSEAKSTTRTWNSGTTGWHQWVATANGSNNVKIYVNGVLETSTTATTGDPTTGVRWLAGGPVTNSSGGIFAWRGWVDALMGLTRVYNAELDATQVLQNYNANKADYGL